MDRTLPLTAAHKTARMGWAEEHILEPDKWISIIFSDEKKLNLDGPDGFKYYWRDMRRPAPAYVRRQNGGGSVMVWGAFSAAGKSKLAILRGCQNSDFASQQDNASIHASRETKQFLEENEMSTMVWPDRSPDGNPIDNVWSAMAAKVYAHGLQYHTVAELDPRCWDAIGQEYLLRLVESMPRRCLAVIKQKGGLTKYKLLI
ncbi:hypothetical protein PC119_g11430 [Phytophthora cactorum]|nr:hypothetical protein PC114_g11842 [Phytophthora cactorum]KAG3016307.1 hypothetical protein PC119_g11430 [Phytophthora cactorum]KAG3083438.1 hypothetical protein PC122_g10545 [Phytophthora cactorum]KAG3196130.1 hypothetical protein PC128_g7919 [Phytophthora cactorum]